MSILALMGMVHAFVAPGNRTAASILATSSSQEMRSGQMGRNRGFRKSGIQEEYQRFFGLQWLSGFRITVVSIMENGAGSVEVSARPALPKTRSTSGKLFRTLSCRSIRSWAWATDIPGSVVGM